MQEKESIMGHRLEIGIFNPRDDRAVWYLGGASVPPGPVIPRVKNANLKLMPIIDSHRVSFLFIVSHFSYCVSFLSIVSQFYLLGRTFYLCVSFFLNFLCLIFTLIYCVSFSPILCLISTGPFFFFS